MVEGMEVVSAKRAEWNRLASWVQLALRYIVARQNPDGGYNFCQGVDSGTQDTYYALAIFNLLNLLAPNKDATVRWLQRFPADNIFSYYYVTKGLVLGDGQVDGSLVSRVLALRRPHGGFGEIDVGVEAFSEFEATYMATEILRGLHVDFDCDSTAQWLLKYLNPDGGFGAKGYSNLISTFHALASLNNLGYTVKELDDTILYTRSCEKARGGFTAVPGVSLPYLEDIYAGVAILDLVDQKCSYPEATRDLILGLQNNNGGFRRSLELGLSTFEDTYYAMRILRALGYV